MAIITDDFPHRPNTELRNPSAFMTTDRGKRRFRFSFKMYKVVVMYITFPKDGGVRIHNSKDGAFAPSELCDITYEDIDEYSFKMTGKDTSVIVESRARRWSIKVYDKNMQYKTGFNNVGCGRWDYSDFQIGINIDEVPAMYRLLWPVTEGEEFFGFGERWNALRQQRNQLMMWNVDIGVRGNGFSSMADDYCEKTNTYKNVPLIHSTNDYSIFFNTYLPILFDIGYSNPSVLRSEIYGTDLDLYIWTGTPAENISNYYRLTGKPFIPPKWAFDYWIGGAAITWNKPDKEHAADRYAEVLDIYEENKVRISVAYVENRPLENIFQLFKERGIRIFMWAQHGLVAYHDTELDYNDYYIKRASDPTKVMNQEYIDFTNPSSRDVICDKFDVLWDNGVCGEMVDFSDSMPEDSICFNGKTGTEMHNAFAYWFGRRMNEAFTERLGEDFILFQRSGCAGSQHYTTSFGGDSHSTFLGLRRSVWQILSAAASGFSIWGSDIGGFFLKAGAPSEGPEFEELYIRWVQFGTFSPLMRDHSSHGKHHPWTNGERGLANFKNYYTLRLQIIDAVYSAALKSGKYGSTVVNSMAVAYGMSPTIDTQYLFCDDFLVRPIMELGQREASIIFPEDGFYSLYDGTRYDAGECIVEAPLERMPVYVKAGSVIPYNLYSENVIPTWEKDQYEEAVLLTAPQYERKTEIHTDEGVWAITNTPKGDGFQVTSDKACPRRIVIVLGTTEAQLTSDVEVTNVSYDKEGNRTIFALSSDWTVLHVK